MGKSMGTGARIAAAGVAVLALAACGGGTDTAAPAGSTSAAAPASTASASAPANAATEQTAGRYVDYATYQADPAAYAAQGRVVLFFHASWCPNCKRTNTNLTEEPAAIPADLTVVKVDFDTETDLRAKYGITQQHTFVSVGPDGTERAKWSGTHTAAEIAQKAA